MKNCQKKDGTSNEEWRKSRIYQVFADQTGRGPAISKPPLEHQPLKSHQHHFTSILCVGATIIGIITALDKPSSPPECRNRRFGPITSNFHGTIHSYSSNGPVTFKQQFQIAHFIQEEEEEEETVKCNMDMKVLSNAYRGNSIIIFTCSSSCRKKANLSAVLVQQCKTK